MSHLIFKCLWQINYWVQKLRNIQIQLDSKLHTHTYINSGKPLHILDIYDFSCKSYRRCHCNGSTKKDDIEMTWGHRIIFFIKLILYNKWEENSTFKQFEVVVFCVVFLFFVLTLRVTIQTCFSSIRNLKLQARKWKCVTTTVQPRRTI